MEKLPYGGPSPEASRERRSGMERRRESQFNMRALLFGGRRKNLRRQADRRKASLVDQYQQSLFGIIALILFFSVIDALLTLFLINHGAIEINPIMAFYLDLGPYVFLGVKYGLLKAQLAIGLSGQDRDMILTEIIDLLAHRSEAQPA